MFDNPGEEAGDGRSDVPGGWPMSDHKIPVIQVGEIRDHPDADRLEITDVDGWRAVVGKGEFKEGDAAVYIPPDFTVPVDIECFKFLAGSAKADGRARIRVKKIRGVWSEGLLIPFSRDTLEHFDQFMIGDDVSSALGIERYEPQATITNAGEMGDKFGPPVHVPVFDVENFQKYPRLFNDGEEVVVTEKIHGCNGRFLFYDGSMYVGSRKNWWKDTPDNLWWKALRNTPGLEELLKKEWERIVIYGEVFGQVQRGYNYGCAPGENQVRIFAAYDTELSQFPTPWMDHAMLQLYFDVDTLVPELYRGEFRRDRLLPLAEGNTVIGGADHIREGIVITPVRERRVRVCPNNRLALKMVSRAYLLKE
jgi:RNA ligase (TIGR02306 family)